MQNISDKADSTAGATGELTASEYNNHKNELQGAVTSAGQTLNAVTLLQLSKALFINGAGATSVQDSGTDDSIILSPVTGASGLNAPDAYADFDGGLLLFNKTSPNLTTAVTVNFGQTGTELGAKTLVRSDASVPLAGDIEGLCLIQWDNTNDRWVILRNGAETFGYAISSAVTVNPQFQKNTITVDTSGGALLVPIGDGLYLGQEFELICDGVGNVTSTLTGQKSVVATEISDGFSLKGRWDGVKWILTIEVTADYISGNFDIQNTSSGRMYIDHSDVQVTNSNASDLWGTTAGTTFFNTTGHVFPMSFSAAPKMVASPNEAAAAGYAHPRNITASGFSMVCGFDSNGANVSFDDFSRGRY